MSVTLGWMQARRWVLVGVTVVLVGALAFAVTRDVADEGDAVAVTDLTSTTTVAPTSTLSPTTSASAPAASAHAATSTTVPARVGSSTTRPAPPFTSSIETISAAELGASWRDGCPVPPEELRAVDLSHWDDDGAVRQGRIIVHRAYAEAMVAAFSDIYEARFPIHRMTPIDAYDGDDQASMRANNTSAFNCRFVSGTTRWSEHAFGRAIDVNPLVNPYVKGSSVDPPEGEPYADRRKREPGMIHGGDVVVRAFATRGWEWGGYWSNGRDYQHFSATGR